MLQNNRPRAWRRRGQRIFKRPGTRESSANGRGGSGRCRWATTRGTRRRSSGRWRTPSPSVTGITVRSRQAPIRTASCSGRAPTSARNCARPASTAPIPTPSSGTCAAGSPEPSHARLHVSIQSLQVGDHSRCPRRGGHQLADLSGPEQRLDRRHARVSGLRELPDGAAWIVDLSERSVPLVARRPRQRCTARHAAQSELGVTVADSVGASGRPLQPSRGGGFTQQVLEALTSNPDVWPRPRSS